MVPSSATPPTTTRWPGSRMPWPCSEFTRMHLTTQDLRKDAARNQTDVVAVGEDDGRIGMNFAVPDAACDGSCVRAARGSPGAAMPP